jgi:coenzyme F420-reducing hydrogenase delta subunit
MPGLPGADLAQVDAALAVMMACLVFTCNWCPYAGADLAGIESASTPSARIIRTMCSARFEEFLERAFER